MILEEDDDEETDLTGSTTSATGGLFFSANIASHEAMLLLQPTKQYNTLYFGPSGMRLYITGPYSYINSQLLGHFQLLNEISANS